MSLTAWVLAMPLVATVLIYFGSIIGALAVFAAKLEGRARPWLVRFCPAAVVVFIYSSSRALYLWALGRARFSPASGRYRETRALGLTFRNDLGNAAGLDKDGTLLELNWRLGAGFAVVGTVLNKTHTGNLPRMSTLWGLLPLGRWNPWVPLPDAHAGLNSLGLPSKGVDAAVRNIAAFRRAHAQGGAIDDFPIGVSIMGHPAQSGDEKLEGVLECVRKCCGVADFLEVNESCPNVAHAQHGSKAELRAALRARLAAIVAARDGACAALAPRRTVPLLVKLGSLGADDAEIADTVRFLAACGVDGLVAVNTQTDYAAFKAELSGVDWGMLSFYTKRFRGGFSGPPIFARSLDQVTRAARVVADEGLALTVVHAGGIEGAADVAASRAGGAALREWYTGLMHNIATRPVGRFYGEVTAPQ